MITKILLGVLIGALSSASGLGGGFMVVPYLIYLEREAKVAAGTSFLFVLLVAISSLAAHYRAGNLDYKTGLLLAVGGVVGAQLGPALVANISEVVFKRAFAALLISIGIWLFVKSVKG